VLTVAYGVLVFTVTIVVLVTILLVVRSRLLPGGEVAVTVNGDTARPLRVRAGQTLLAALAERGVYVPSGCGGQGTCGICKVTVASGGGALLATERAHIGRREAEAGVRLACQVKVRGDLAVELPAEILAVRRWHCRVRSNRNVATFIKELVLEIPAGEELAFRAGGYVQIVCPPHEICFRDFAIEAEYAGDWERLDLWRFTSRSTETVQRAYSMANYPGEAGGIILNVRIALPPPGVEAAPPGVCSSYLFSRKPGDEVLVSGPFGNFFARGGEREMCFIGGGAGMAPMRSHIFDQLVRLHSRRTITFWYGARSLCEAFYIEDFDTLAARHDNFTWHLALSEPRPEDQWNGATGFIHQVLFDLYLKDHAQPEEVEYYLCGPPAMIDACRTMLFDLGVEPENVMFDDFGS